MLCRRSNSSCSWRKATCSSRPRTRLLSRGQFRSWGFAGARRVVVQHHVHPVPPSVRLPLYRHLPGGDAPVQGGQGQLSTPGRPPPSSTVSCYYLPMCHHVSFYVSILTCHACQRLLRPRTRGQSASSESPDFCNKMQPAGLLGADRVETGKNCCNPYWIVPPLQETPGTASLEKLHFCNLPQCQPFPGFRRRAAATCQPGCPAGRWSPGWSWRRGRGPRRRRRLGRLPRQLPFRTRTAPGAVPTPWSCRA